MISISVSAITNLICPFVLDSCGNWFLQMENFL